jgi:hypothetical protein
MNALILTVRYALALLLVCCLVNLGHTQTTPNLAWAKRLGNNSLPGVFPPALTSDNFGNSFIAGVFTTNNANIGGAVLSSPNNAPSDGYIIKYNAQGQVAWSITTNNIIIGSLGSTDSNIIDRDSKRMATDNEGNLYVTGKCKKLIGYRSRISNYLFPLDSALVYPYANRDFPVVAKISVNGGILWVRTFTDDSIYIAAAMHNSSSYVNYQNEIFIDTYGNLNLTGVFYNRIGFDSTHVLFTDTSYNPADIDTIRTEDNVYDSIHILMRQQAGMYKATFNPQGDVLSAIKLSSADDEYLANQQKIFYHVPPIPNVNPILQFLNQRETKIENVRADAGNNLYRLRHRTVSNNLDTNPILYSYTPSGVLLETDTLPIYASTAFKINDFTVTRNGDIVLTGVWKGTLTINGVNHHHYSTASYDGFVCVLNKGSHTTQSVYTRKTATDDHLVRAEVDESGNIYACGYSSQLFSSHILKINPAGTLLWERGIMRITSASVQGTRWVKFLSQNGNGNVWVSGSYYHSVYFSNAYQFTTPTTSGNNHYNGFLAQYGQCNTSKPVLDAVPYTQVCEGDSLLLTANFSDTTTYNYQWSTGDTTQSIYVTQPGKYYYIAREKQDSLGCYGKSNEVWVSLRSLPTVSITAIPDNATVCAGDSVTLTAIGAETYTWNNDISNDVAFVPLQTETYTVTATDSSGCTNTATQQIIVNALPTINITAIPDNATVCAGDTVTLTASGAETYTWNNDISNEVAFVPLQTETYTVTATDSSGCTNTATQHITVNALPTISITTIPNNATVCAGDSVTFTASGAETYTWNNDISNDAAFVPLQTETYTVTATDSNGCTNTATQQIIVNALPTISITSIPDNATVCAGDSVTLTASGAETYTWNNDISNEMAFIPLQTETYTVTATDSSGCTNTATQQIIVNALPTISITAIPDNAIVCAGDAVTLIASGAETYTWNHDISNDVAFVPVQTETYTVTATDSSGCTNTATQHITVNALPTISITAIPDNATVCAGDAVTLIASGAETYTWSNDISNEMAFVPAQTETYTVTATDSSGCTNTATQQIIVNALPSTPVITVVGSELISSAANGNQWYLEGDPISGAIEQSYTATQNGSYSVVVTDSNGCTAQSDTLVFLITNIAAYLSNKGIQVYPNPADQFINVAFSKQDILQETIIGLYDMEGKLVRSVAITHPQATYMLDSAQLPNGTYLLKVENGHNTLATQKVIVRH